MSDERPHVPADLAAPALMSECCSVKRVRFQLMMVVCSGLSLGVPGCPLHGVDGAVVPDAAFLLHEHEEDMEEAEAEHERAAEDVEPGVEGGEQIAEGGGVEAGQDTVGGAGRVVGEEGEVVAGVGEGGGVVQEAIGRDEAGQAGQQEDQGVEPVEPGGARSHELSFDCQE